MANENGTESDVTVTLQTDRSAVSEWTIDKRVFGKFNEHLAGAIYPGIYADYVTNGLFEVWNYANLEGSPDVLYPNVETFPSLAYPWEPSMSRNPLNSNTPRAESTDGKTNSCSW